MSTVTILRRTQKARALLERQLYLTFRDDKVQNIA